MQIDPGDSLVTVFLRGCEVYVIKIIINNGGGGGNRTRVREPFGRASTYIAYILNSPLRTPTGRIPERLSYEVSPLFYRIRRGTILFF